MIPSLTISAKTLLRTLRSPLHPSSARSSSKLRLPRLDRMLRILDLKSSSLTPQNPSTIDLRTPFKPRSVILVLVYWLSIATKLLEELRANESLRRELAMQLLPEIVASKEARIAVARAVLREVATKEDLKELEARLKEDLRELEARLKGDIARVESRIEKVDATLVEVQARLSKVVCTYTELSNRVDAINVNISPSI